MTLFRLFGLFVALILLGVPAQAQDLSLPFLDGGSVSLRSIQLILLITVLSLAPAILIMVTCFPFLVTVLAILRQAIATNSVRKPKARSAPRA